MQCYKAYCVISVCFVVRRRFLRVCIHNIMYAVYYIKGQYIRIYTQWRSWLKHCGTSRKDAGSIPDGVIAIFPWHNPSYDPGVDSVSNRNHYQEYFLGGNGGRCVGLTVPIVLKSGNLNVLEPSGPVQVCTFMYVRVCTCTVSRCAHCAHGLATGLTCVLHVSFRRHDPLL